MSLRYLPSFESAPAQMPPPWVGVDLDGTLANYTEFKGWDQIGEPVPAMVSFVKKLLAMGITVKVLTARASVESRALNNLTFEQVEKVIQDWTEKHIGMRLPVVTEKGCATICLFDDSAVQVEKNTGNIVGGAAALGPMAEKIIEAYKQRTGQ